MAKTIKNLNFRIEFSSFDHSSKFCIQFLSQLDILSIKPVISNCAPWNSTGIGTAGQGRAGEGRGKAARARTPISLISQQLCLYGAIFKCPLTQSSWETLYIHSGIWIALTYSTIGTISERRWSTTITRNSPEVWEIVSSMKSCSSAFCCMYAALQFSLHLPLTHILSLQVSTKCLLLYKIPTPLYWHCQNPTF